MTSVATTGVGRHGPRSEGVRFAHVSKSYGTSVVVSDFSLSVEPGEFVTILGPSGSGKTTVLNMLAGFTEVGQGSIYIGDRDVTCLAPEVRGLGMVFQSFALFPNLTVLQNVEFPLRMRRIEKGLRRKQAIAALERVQLADLMDRRPDQISGGQKQRVSLARALVFNPPVLLMDECLSALDLKLREQLQLEIKRLHRELHSTILFVTHDQGEAMAMADRIAVMDAGRLVQVGTPASIYDAPVNRFVASFIGKTNIFDVVLPGATAPAIDCVRINRWPAGWATDLSSIVVRPTKIVPVRSAERLDFTFPGTVTDYAFLGQFHQFCVELDSGKEILIQSSTGQEFEGVKPGDQLNLDMAMLSLQRLDDCLDAREPRWPPELNWTPLRGRHEARRAWLAGWPGPMRWTIDR